MHWFLIPNHVYLLPSLSLALCVQECPSCSSFLNPRPFLPPAFFMFIPSDFRLFRAQCLSNASCSGARLSFLHFYAHISPISQPHVHILAATRRPCWRLISLIGTLVIIMRAPIRVLLLPVASDASVSCFVTDWGACCEPILDSTCQSRLWRPGQHPLHTVSHTRSIVV